MSDEAIISVKATGFDVESAMERVLGSGSVVEVDTLAPGTVLGEVQDGTLLVKGDMGAGASVEGAQSLVIIGSILGTPEEPCRIAMEGDVVVLGSVRQANLSGRRIQVGKWVSKSILATEEDLDIGGDVVDVRFFSGSAGPGRHRLEAQQKRIKQSAKEWDSLEQQVYLDQRRVDKLLQATHMAFDFNIGDIVRRRERRLVIDLEPFYRVVQGKAEEEVDRALLEFFSRAVVGLLTRVNRQYIMEGESHRKIFTTVVRKMHDLLFLVRKRDKQTRKLDGEKAVLISWIETYEKKQSAVWVGGSVMPQVEMVFTLFSVVFTENNEISFSERQATLRVPKGGSGDLRQVVRVGMNGDDTVENISAKALSGMRFYLDGEDVMWKYGLRDAINY